MAGEGFARASALEGWTRALDAAASTAPVAPARAAAAGRAAAQGDQRHRGRPAEGGPVCLLRAQVLRLLPLDAVDAEPSAAWRGTEVHRILQEWWDEDRCAPEKLIARARAMLATSERIR